MDETVTLENPYSLDETIACLRHYLTATKSDLALALLEKILVKAEENDQYAEEMESYLLRGSTIELRALCSPFGDYMAKTSQVMPYYPHHDAVNMIDTAMLHVKLGDTDQAIRDYNTMHNRG